MRVPVLPLSLVLTLLGGGAPAVAADSDAQPAATETPKTDAELDAIKKKVAVHAGATGDDGTDGHSEEDVEEGRTHVVDKPVEYPYHYERFGDFIEGAACPPGFVRVDVILVTVLGPGAGQYEEVLVRDVCYEWARLDGSDSLPTVTPGFAGEVVEKYLPIPTFSPNPTDYAVTWIETWLWYGDDGSLGLDPIDHDGDPGTPPKWGTTVTAVDAGNVNTITARVWIDEYRWDMGAGEVTSDVPGSREEPAAEFLFSTTSPSNRVQAYAVWKGDFSASNRLFSSSGTLPPITIGSGWVDYPVYQVRSAPVARTGG